MNKKILTGVTSCTSAAMMFMYGGGCTSNLTAGRHSGIVESRCVTR